MAALMLAVAPVAADISGNATTISPALTLNTTVTDTPGPTSVLLSWSDTQDGTYTTGARELDIKQGQHFDLWVMTSNLEPFVIESVLLLIDGVDQSQFAFQYGGELTTMDWSDNLGAFYFGPLGATPFAMSVDYTGTIHVRGTAKAAGEYELTIYAVQVM